MKTQSRSLLVALALNCKLRIQLFLIRNFSFDIERELNKLF